MASSRMVTVWICILILAFLVGCGSYSLIEDKEKCALEVSDMLTIHYDGREYVLLDEEVSVSNVGEWVGYIYKNVSGDMFTTIYLDKKNPDMINVAVDNLFLRAIEKDKWEETYGFYVIDKEESEGQQEVYINANNATQLIYLDKVYQVTEVQMSREELGDFIACISRKVIYDTENLMEISKGEALVIDWNGSQKQGRAVSVYGSVYYKKNSKEELGVEVNGKLYMAKYVKEWEDENSVDNKP